ncbi:MAG: pilus assembly protein TadG-related protein [Xanthobacteraceae bacterium]
MQFMRFLHDRAGSVAPVVAGVAIPIISIVGAAVDYSRANSLKASLQSALDSTALALTKKASGDTSDQFSVDATAYFNSIFHQPAAQNLKITANYESTPSPKIVMKATAAINTTFLNLPGIGIPQIEVAATATSTWSNSRLRVALALDNTGSMAQSGKMAALKTASHNLITQLSSAAQQNGDVYISIIPFGKDVNVGAANVGATWVDFTAWSAANGHCNKSTYTTQSTCTSHSGVWTAANHTTWNGCVTDRDQNYDTTNAAPTSGNNSSKFPAEQYGSCPAQLMALSYDYAALNARIDQMQPAGNTNQTIGLQWAWQSLSQVAPLNAPAKDPNYQYQDIIILMTDGLNTENRWSTSQSAVDLRTQKACDNIKAAGVTLYTVLVMAGNSTILQNCASDPTKYFVVNSSSQLITTFDAIGGQLAKLHLAK